MIDLNRRVVAAAPPSLVCAMSTAEIALLASSLRCARRYLEFGAGGSTLLAADLVAESVTSVESSPAWVDRLRAHVGETSGAGRVTLRWVDIGPVDGLGYPTDPARSADWPRYHDAVWQDVPGESLDLFLVDGRFRVACFLQIVSRCRPDALILVHDFAPRPAYREMTQFGREVCRVEGLSGFLPRPNLDRSSLRQAIVRHGRVAH